MMGLGLDQPSRAAVGRFCVKLGASAALAWLSGGEPALVMSSWLTLYAAFTAVIAMLRTERFEPGSFNHLDEMIWLEAASQALRIASRVL